MDKERPRTKPTAPEVASRPQAAELCELFLAELEAHRERLRQLLHLVTLEASRERLAPAAMGSRNRCRRPTRASA